jgi:N-acetylglucosaminyl-diphospho-decaprenol L-rhamnosyltransferase
MSAMGFDLAVVVVTYNSSHVVGKLLDSLPLALDGLHAEVVVVDNGSADDTVALLQARSDCRVIVSTNAGYAGGINRGISAAEPADAVLILNPDVVLQPGAIAPLLAALALPGTGIVAPQVRSADGELFHSLRREPTLLRATGLTRTRIPVLSECVNDDHAYADAHVVDWALGAVLLFSRACYEAVGGWDESFFLYSEETQFSLDARKLGYLTRYVPSAVAMHIGAQSGTSHRTYSMMVINRVRLYRRRHGLAASWCYFFLTILSELSWVARGQRNSRFAIVTLLRPGRRPAELGASASAALLPR